MSPRSEARPSIVAASGLSALPAGNKYELVLDKAEHSVFTDRPLPGDKTGGIRITTA